MSVAVYLSGDSIRIAEGKAVKKGLKVKKLISIQMPSDSMINGVVTNEIAIKESLAAIWKQHKLSKDDIRIAIDSSSVLLKAMTVPLTKERNIYSMIKREFADVENSDELIFDYSIEQRRAEGGGGQILAFAADRNFIGSYIDLFKGVRGAKITRITAAQESTVRFIRSCKRMKGRTFITAFIDGNILSLTLFTDSQYKFSNRSRLLSDKGTAEYADEIAYAISSIIQFNRAEIRDIFFFGMREEDTVTLSAIDALLEKQEPKMFPHMSEMLLTKKPPFGSEDLTEFLYCAGCLQ